jgi:DNA (cytosine-5)-methyltransferase 1
LEDIGYEVQAFIIPASGINAPHQRERLWIVAHSSLYANGLSTEGRVDMGGELLEGPEREEKTNRFGIISKNAPDSDKLRRQEQYRNTGEEKGINKGQGNRFICNAIKHSSEDRNAPNSDLHGFDECNGNDEINASERGFDALNDIDQISINTERIGRIKKWNDNGQFKETQQEKCGELKFSRTDSTQDRWRKFPTQSPVCGGDDGISYGLDNITFPKWRNESIKGYGNAVVPQVVYRIFKTIEYIQNLKQ